MKQINRDQGILAPSFLLTLHKLGPALVVCLIKIIVVNQSLIQVSIMLEIVIRLPFGGMVVLPLLEAQQTCLLRKFVRSFFLQWATFLMQVYMSLFIENGCLIPNFPFQKCASRKLGFWQACLPLEVVFGQAWYQASGGCMHVGSTEVDWATRTFQTSFWFHV